VAKKKRLTQGQIRRVRGNQTKRLEKQDTQEWDDALLGQQQEGVVISRFGQHADVEDATGTTHRCNLRRSIASLVTGDRVVWRLGNEQLQGISGIIEAVHERKTVLTRPDFYDGIKPIAANIDQIVIVSSVVPEFSTNIIDRYIVAAEDVKIRPVILLNKIDLLSPDEMFTINKQLQTYRDIGYDVWQVSSHQGEGLSELQGLLNNKTTIFVGQSGVGKSSLVNAIMPEVEADIGDVSEKSGLGTHTTTTARLYHFPSGGDLIDSPGVREFSLWHMKPEEIAKGFIEFRDHIGQCRFRDCKHKNDPGCALQEAVAKGKIKAARFNNYLRILDTMLENRPTRHVPVRK
jgi:ribosome biogenesis GTPase